jgi:hypothetical protein
MSDPDDAVAAALAANRRLAASRLVRKQEIEAELARLRDARSEAGAARMETLSLELATVTAEYEGAVAEMDALRKLARTAAAPAIGLAERDPIVRSAEEIALDNARAHIADLVAQAELGEADAKAIDPTEVASTPPADADAEARAAFEELRAKRGGPSTPGGGPRRGGKKTL